MAWLLSIGMVVILILAVWWGRVLHRRRVLQLFVRQHQPETDGMVDAALTRLNWVHPHPFASAPVNDVWGHGVLAFEYELAVPEGLTPTKTALNQALVAVAEAADVHGYTETTPAYTVTDFWVRAGRVHFDVAAMQNAATLEYAADVARVDDPDSQPPESTH